MKQVIIVNEALNLPRGKLAAQVAHASVASLFGCDGSVTKQWLEQGMPKVVLEGASSQDITELYTKAVDAGLAAYIVKDAGKTVVEAGTITCVGIGPAATDDIDEVTGHLNLLR